MNFHLDIVRTGTPPCSGYHECSQRRTDPLDYDCVYGYLWRILRAGPPAPDAWGEKGISYDRNETKLARTVSRDGGPSSITEYRGNLVYEDGSLKYVLVDGGMVSMEGSAPRYLYFLDDHLGSTRVVAAEDGTVAQVNHYYPFGMSYASRTMSSDLVPRPGSGVIGGPVIGRGHEIGEENDSLEAASFTTGQPYRFIGNELYADNGLGLYDFKARLYDPATGRFLSVDPLAEKNYSVSPYAYCNNNPLILVDKEGKLPDFIWDVANVVMDVKSLVTNVATGNIGGAIVDGIGLVVDVASAAVPGVPGGAGTALKAVRGGEKVADAAKAVDKVGDANRVVGPYSNIPNPRNAGPGKNVTRSQKEKILEQNRQNNGGILRSDGDGRPLNPAKKSQKGQPADLNQAEIDHIVPKSNGGTNENSNLQVLSKEENLKKSNKMF